MKLIYRFLIILITPTSVFGQNEWRQIITPGGPNLNSIYFIDKNVGWAVGENGKCIKTTDGGENWNLCSTGVTDVLNDIAFYSNNVGFIVGNNNVVLKTVDGGISWVKQNIGVIDRDLNGNPITRNLFGIKILSSNKVIIQILRNLDYSFVNKYLYTSNAGDTWLLKSIGNTDLHIGSFSFINESIGYAGTGPAYINSSDTIAIYKTTNSGLTWSRVFLKPNLEFSPRGFNFLNFVNENVGYGLIEPNFTGCSKFWKTTNGGQSWSEISSCSACVKEIIMKDEYIGYIFNWTKNWPNSTIYGSVDGFSSCYPISEDYIFKDVCSLKTLNSPLWAVKGNSVSCPEMSLHQKV